MPLLTATSGSHFKAEELILWVHKVSEWFPKRDSPSGDMGTGLYHHVLTHHRSAASSSGIFGELSPLLKLTLWALLG